MRPKALILAEAVSNYLNDIQYIVYSMYDWLCHLVTFMCLDYVTESLCKSFARGPSYGRNQPAVQ